MSWEEACSGSIAHHTGGCRVVHDVYPASCAEEQSGIVKLPLLLFSNIKALVRGRELRCLGQFLISLAVHITASQYICCDGH